MDERQSRSAAAFVPKTRSLKVLRAAAQGCRGCDLYKNATQAVFGAGPKSARVMFVGEQPGDQEDRQGEPFVGPAGALLDKALTDAGISRDIAYLTNAVKHFKWEPRGKRRIHKKPRASELKAVSTVAGGGASFGAAGSRCLSWSDRRPVSPRRDVQADAAVRPGLIESAGAARRGTIHPSAVLRAPDSEGRRDAYKMLVADLKVVARALKAEP
jgi:uracil-DNA glycosylase